MRTVASRDGDGDGTEAEAHAGPGGLTAGTVIATAEGPVPAGWLRPGDLVVTRDRGPQPLRWIGRLPLALAELRRNPALWPVRIEAGALAPTCPDGPLVVAPGVRLVLRSPELQLLFALEEVSAAACDIVGWRGVETEMPTADLVYQHLLFDRHEVVLADGHWCESLWLGDCAGEAWDAARAAVDPGGHVRRARPALARWEAHLLAPPDGEAAAGTRRSA